jgi:hypothetical protein
VHLSDSDLERIEKALARLQVHGERYPAAMQARIDR